MTDVAGAIDPKEIDAANKNFYESQMAALKLENKALSDQLKIEQEVKSRTIITWATTATYCFVVIFIAVLVLWLVWRVPSDREVDKAIIDTAMDLLKIGVLPIVTLVIGYYLGQRATLPAGGQTPRSE